MSTSPRPYSPVVRSGGWLVVSGQLGLVDGALVDGGAEAEVAQALENLEALLHAEGATLADVVKTTVFVVDLPNDLAVVNAEYQRRFPEPRPARSAIGVAALPIGASVEVEAWARVP